MARLLYCLPSFVGKTSNLGHPGMARFADVFKLYGPWVIPVDRTGTITSPIRTVSDFPIPTYRSFTGSFAEICNERAIEVLGNAEKLGAVMYVMYSGGIDSTLVLVSLLKNATAEQKKNIVILLSHESIAENPRFYEEHIRGKLRVGSSIAFPELIGEDCYLLSGEHNDMVMGSEKIGKLMTRFGASSIYQPYNREMVTSLYAGALGGDIATADFYMDLFERIRDKAPFPVTNNMDFLWWINFAIKWQACFYYILLFAPARNAHKVTREYVNARFVSFFNTDDFQLWSMNNLDKRIKDTWKSYKWVCKDIIYDYTKDADYRDNKMKKASLLFITAQQTSYHFLDDNMHFTNDLTPEEYLEPVNDFV